MEKIFATDGTSGKTSRPLEKIRKFWIKLSEAIVRLNRRFCRGEDRTRGITPPPRGQSTLGNKKSARKFSFLTVFHRKIGIVNGLDISTTYFRSAIFGNALIYKEQRFVFYCLVNGTGE